jgi:hypothetical protein
MEWNGKEARRNEICLQVSVRRWSRGYGIEAKKKRKKEWKKCEAESAADGRSDAVDPFPSVRSYTVTKVNFQTSCHDSFKFNSRQGWRKVATITVGGADPESRIKGLRR